MQIWSRTTLIIKGGMITNLTINLVTIKIIMFLVFLIPLSKKKYTIMYVVRKVIMHLIVDTERRIRILLKLI
jgi:hypothetical protein